HDRKGRDGHGDVRGEFGGGRGRGGEEAADAFGDRQSAFAFGRGRPARAGRQRRDGRGLRFRPRHQAGPRAEPAGRHLQDGHGHAGGHRAVVRGEVQIGVGRAGPGKHGATGGGRGGGAPPE